jgi:ribosomal protein S27E
MGELKAIETKYAGCRFRSRLEARWAVFFNHLGVKWEYEKEGYDLGEAGCYLPDFWLPDVWYRHRERGTFLEVKGVVPPQYDPFHDHQFELAKLSGLSCHLVVGQPCGNSTGRCDYWSVCFGWTNDDGSNDAGWDTPFCWYHCPRCGDYMLCFPETNYQDCPNCQATMVWSWGDSDDVEPFLSAARFAKSARFEHGESG